MTTIPVVEIPAIEPKPQTTEENKRKRKHKSDIHTEEAGNVATADVEEDAERAERKKRKREKKAAKEAAKEAEGIKPSEEDEKGHRERKKAKTEKARVSIGGE